MSRSIFAKLLAIMITMAVALLALVTWFFMFQMLPAMRRSAEPFVIDAVQRIARAHPNLAEVKRMTAASRLDLAVRYEGPDGTWSTSPWLPPIAQVPPPHGPMSFGNEDYVVRLPDGSAYLFVWNFRRRTIGAHQLLLHGLLGLMIVTIVVTYLVLRRMLRPVRTLGDGVARLAAGELDVTLPAPTHDELGAVTRAFNEMVGRVREMIRARDRLLLDVSHELRSPLTRMRVAIELLPEGKARDGMTADIAEMEAMIAELLELERLRDGRGLRTARIDLAPIVREVASAFPRVRIVSLPAALPVDADGEKLRIVIRNLIENAVKYSLPDSTPVEVSAAIDDAHVVLRVTDDGQGVPEEDRASLFEPFFRVDRSRAKMPAGYGLGLSICKRIVEAHGGTISVQPNAGRGTTFVVTLPSSAG
jgi:signal transduction histidine kinase